MGSQIPFSHTPRVGGCLWLSRREDQTELRADRDSQLPPGRAVGREAVSISSSPCVPGLKNGASQRKSPKSWKNDRQRERGISPGGETEAQRGGRTCSEAPSSTRAAQFCLDSDTASQSEPRHSRGSPLRRGFSSPLQH